MTEHTFHVNPMGAVRMNKSDAWKKRPAVLRYRAFKDALRLQAPPLRKDPMIVNLEFHIPMPASWSEKKKAAMFGGFHRTKPDVDNIFKACTDTLWPDNDSLIAKTTASKFWAYKGRILMEVIYDE